MTQDIENQIDEPPALDPTDDGFDEQYMTYLRLMSIQVASITTEERRYSYGSTDLESPSPVTTSEQCYSVSPEVLQAILK